ncbi:DUF1707 SHOCT-like domain-containing protein [Actinophytocola algeriensis]|uniref:DUF1707 domain-containing protein n=1 Tax=Actinophytocola algeriensis TaxID=1768010 RepID=A0A7W7VH74_9PSEU|nr:DUF1707 domain-containing protein [Actinophytocola algeriensis]MBB4910126.1 hypothetical protein [Actinophytocola algeriensis]MBE1480886.1 hypothetical protein [Actinophytocola algeriensis]
MGQADIRTSDTERDEAVTALGVHMATGRLDLGEYEERCGRAAVARTRGDLEALFTDLPAPHPDLSSATPVQLVQRTGQLVGPPRRRGKDLVETPASRAFEVVAGMAFIVGIPAAILLTIFLGQWWVFIPVGVVLMVAGGVSEAAKKPAR